MPITPIGLFSNATAGKDSLYDILESIFVKYYNIQTERFALADELKSELAEFVKTQYGISIFTKDLTEKTLIRPLMVEHGRIKRNLTGGKYWTNILTPKVNESLSNGKLPIICDIRYAVFQDDEYSWLKDELKGLLVHIERVLPNGSLVPPANADEKENGLKLAKLSDFYIKWPTTPSLSSRTDFVETQLKGLINYITYK